MNRVINNQALGGSKRKVTDSSSSGAIDSKRSAFGDLTNATENLIPAPVNNKSSLNRISQRGVIKPTLKDFKKPTTRSSTSNSSDSTSIPKKASLTTKDVKRNNPAPLTTKDVKRTNPLRVTGSIKECKNSIQNVKKVVKKPVTTQKTSKPINKVSNAKQVKDCDAGLSADIQKLNLINASKINEIKCNTNVVKYTTGVKKFKRSDLKELLTLQSSGRSTDGSDNNSLLDESECEDKKSLPKEPVIPEYDREFLSDPHQLAMYAMEIFEYMKSREAQFTVGNYMHNQADLTCNMRALLVDWMVEIQENFELNHETLYLAVKYVDLFLNRVRVNKENLQLVGATALFLSCKVDEPIVPMLDDFVHICDNAYTKSAILKMEVQMLRTVQFEMGVPISYSFLRRYARSIQLSMPFLTLARYILELSLLEYNAVFFSESKQAAAALYLALKMTKQNGWNKTLESCSGYKVSDFKRIVLFFNAMLRREYKDLVVVKNKYSHEIFFEVAKTPKLRDDELDLPAYEDPSSAERNDQNMEFMLID